MNLRNFLSASIIALATPAMARADALASIYNGEQFQLNGQLLVQDADHPDDFYVLPQTFHIQQQSTYDPTTDTLKKKMSINHQVIAANGNQYSDYTMKMVLDEPTQMQLMQASMQLRRTASPNARIKGMAPICGMRLTLPGLETSTEAPIAGKFDPNTTFIQYSISSTDAEKCNAILTTTEFTLEYRVPLVLEPTVAKNLTSDVGLVLQPIDLILPYKYKDKVSVAIDARSAIDQLKASVGLQGSFKFVTAGVQASMEKMMNALKISGQLQVDCQNPDKTMCDRFVDQAVQILTKTFFTYLPMATSGDTNPLVIADKDKAVNASLFKIQLAFDEQSAERIGQFKVDFSNTVYDSVHGQARIEASRVPLEALDPIVRKLLP
jgi:hypothetical protein